MTKTEFENLIAAYGASPARWPEDRRAAGELYLKTTPDAETLLQAETKLDSALDTVLTRGPSDILKAKIMKSTTGQVQALPAHRESQVPAKAPSRLKYWKIAASFAAVLAVGGLTYSAYTSQPELETEETVWLEAANELGVSDIYNWVEGAQ